MIRAWSSRRHGDIRRPDNSGRGSPLRHRRHVGRQVEHLSGQGARPARQRGHRSRAPSSGARWVEDPGGHLEVAGVVEQRLVPLKGQK